MFNATVLIRQWNEHVILNRGNSPHLKQRDLKEFLSNKGTREFIDALIAEENLNTPKMVYQSSRGKNGSTWMHPYLFTKFAMWLNPRFEVQVIKFVYDQMIKYRNDAGDAYRELSSAVATIVPRNEMKAKMRKVGEAVNWVIFNAHEKMLRNKEGDEHKQRELWMFEKKVATLINEGFIRNYDGLIGYLRRQWQTRNTPQILASL